MFWSGRSAGRGRERLRHFPVPGERAVRGFRHGAGRGVSVVREGFPPRQRANPGFL